MDYYIIVNTEWFFKDINLLVYLNSSFVSNIQIDQAALHNKICRVELIKHIEFRKLWPITKCHDQEISSIFLQSFPMIYLYFFHLTICLSK